MKKKKYWLWYWGVNQNDTSIHSKKKKFKNFDKMKTYSLKKNNNTDSGEFCWHRDGKTRRNSTDEIREYLFNEYDRICAKKKIKIYEILKII